MAQTIGPEDLGEDTANQAGQQNNQGNANQAGGSTSPNSQQSSGAGSGGAASGGYQQSTGQPKAQNFNPNAQRGSGYTNIQRIVQANQGNQLGKAVGGGIQQQTGQAQQQLGQAQQNFQQQTAANQADTGANQQLVQNVLASPDQYGTLGTNDPNSQAAGKFQQLISGQYAGPTQLGNADQLQGQVGDANQLAQLGSTTGGQQALLQRFVGNPQYTQGQQAFDQALLGQTGGNSLQQARAQALQLQSKLDRSTTGAQEQGIEQGNRAQGFGQQVQGQFGQAVSGLDTGLQQQATQAQSARDAQYQQTLKDLQSGNITQEQADLIGLGDQTEVTGDFLKNIGNYVTENTNKATAQNIAGTQDYAKINALQQLGGQYSPQDAQKILGQYSGQDAQAGKFASEKGVLADTQGLQGARTAQYNQYHQQLAPAQQGLTGANEILSLVKQRDAAMGPGGMPSPQAMAIQQQIAQKYPGAVNGGWTRSDWAQGLQQSAQKKYNDTLNSVNAAYGGVQQIHITPQQAALQQLAQGQPNVVNTPETALNGNTQVS